MHVPVLLFPLCICIRKHIYEVHFLPPYNLLLSSLYLHKHVLYLQSCCTPNNIYEPLSFLHRSLYDSLSESELSLFCYRKANNVLTYFLQLNKLLLYRQYILLHNYVQAPLWFLFLSLRKLYICVP